MSELPPDVRKIFDQNAAFARDAIVQQGSLTPMYAFSIGNTVLPMAADFDDDDAKQRVKSAARTIVNAFWPSAVAFMMESWFSRKFDEHGRPRYPRASQDPDREEGVTLVVATPEMEKGVILRTVRDAKGAVSDLVESDIPASDMGGALSGLYPSTPPSRQVQRQAQRTLETMIGKEAVRELARAARGEGSSSGS